MARGRRRGRWAPLYDDDVQGARRQQIIDEHLEWLRHRNGKRQEPFDEYPLQVWLNEHLSSLARRRSMSGSYYRNTKVKRDRRKPVTD